MEGSLLVTALYLLYSEGSAPAGSDASALTGRVERLLHHWAGEALIFCSPTHEDSLRERLGGQVHVIGLEMEATDIHRVHAGAQELPPHRNEKKDTREYMTLMCLKSELLCRAKKLRPHFKNYLWSDGGITKILQEADVCSVLEKLNERVAQLENLSLKHILVPGCWTFPVRGGSEVFVERVLWRFCGGFLVAPRELVDVFAATMQRACSHLVEVTGRCTWEVNVWAMIEHDAHLQWYAASHDATIFDFPLEQLP